MCGIVGSFCFENSSFAVTEQYLEKMRDTMVHRGPDGAGTWISPDRRIGLGHRRLSIIDLSPAAGQPMPNEDGSLLVTFNGEIYNHSEIRRELEALSGHCWKTDHSDTEVILHAFEEWGIDCLSRFRGMFAFALWDARNRALWLVRDRIGIKPLYYSVHHGRITFASEIKTLLADPDQQRAVDEEGLFHYLSFLTTPAPRTLFEGIRKLPPATWLRISERGDVVQQRYWDVWDHARPMTGVSEEEMAARVLQELKASVQLRKVSDVPVGVFLSGGIDSSTNAALFSEGEGLPVKTFTIGYEGEYPTCPNELGYANRMAASIGADHHQLLLRKGDLLEFLHRMVWLQDEPIADPVCMPVYYVSKLAREKGVVVAQVGEGADELFWGYDWWKIVLRLQQLDALPFPRSAKRGLLSLLRLLGLQNESYYELLRRSVAGQPVFWGGAEAFPETLKKRLLSPRLKEKFGDRSSWEVVGPIRDRFLAGAWEKGPLSWMTYLDLNFRLPELLLMRVDKMSMGVGLECRVPFLDHEFVELAMSIPEKAKTAGGELKHILKKSVCGVIPDELIYRRKQGFGVPVREWLLDGVQVEVRKTLDDFCSNFDLLDRNEVHALMERGNPKFKWHQMWYLFNLALWHRMYIEGPVPESAPARA